MLQKRSILWLMLFTGVVIHMMSSSNLNIAINSMIDSTANSHGKPLIPVCRQNSSFFGGAEEHKKPGEFHWTNDQKHTLLSSWAWLMGLAQLVGGLLCQKYGGKVVFGYSNLMLGVANFLIPVAAGINIYVLIAVRAAQGMAGGVGIGNAINYFMSRWVPPHERGKFAATMAGLFFGASFSYFLNGFIEYLLGWKYIFYVTGVITTLWSVLWYFIVFDSPKDHPSISESELSLIKASIGNHVTDKKLPIPWAPILTSVPLVVNTMCHFTSMWTTMTFMIYIPMYLTSVFGFPSYRVGELSGLPYFLEGTFSLIFALFTDNILKRKILSTNCTRKLATFLNTIVAAVLFGSIALCGCNVVLVLVLLSLAVMFSGATLSGVYPNVVDLSPNFCAVIHGIQGLVATSAGILSPAVVNYFTKHNKNDPSSWDNVFITTSILSIISGTLFLIFGESQVQWWNSEQEKNKEVNKTLLNGDEKVVEIKPSSPVV